MSDFVRPPEPKGLISLTTLASPSNESARAIVIDPRDGSYYVAGSVDKATTIAQLTPPEWNQAAGFNASDLRALNRDANTTDIFVAKFVEQGRIAWLRLYGASGDDEATSLALGPTGEVYVAGNASGSIANVPKPTDAQNGDFGFLLRLDQKGDYVWGQVWGTEGTDYVNDVAVGPDGGIFVAGQIGPVVGGNEIPSGFIRRSDPTGYVSDFSIIDFSNLDYKFSRINAISVDANGNVYALGEAVGSIPFSDSNEKINVPGINALLIKIVSFIDYATPGPDFGRSWIRPLATETDDIGNDVTIGSDGNIYVVGTTNGWIHTEGSNPTGFWGYGDGGDGSGPGQYPNHQNSSFNALADAKNLKGTAAFIASFDPKGRVLDTEFLDGLGNDGAYSVAWHNNRLYVAGTTESPRLKDAATWGWPDGFIASLSWTSPTGTIPATQLETDWVERVGGTWFSPTPIPTEGGGSVKGVQWIGVEEFSSIAVDSNGLIRAAGSWMPASEEASDPLYSGPPGAGGKDVLVATFEARTIDQSPVELRVNSVSPSEIRISLYVKPGFTATNLDIALNVSPGLGRLQGVETSPNPQYGWIVESNPNSGLIAMAGLGSVTAIKDSSVPDNGLLGTLIFKPSSDPKPTKSLAISSLEFNGYRADVPPTLEVPDRSLSVGIEYWSGGLLDVNQSGQLYYPHSVDVSIGQTGHLLKRASFVNDTKNFVASGLYRSPADVYVTSTVDHTWYSIDVEDALATLRIAVDLPLNGLDPSPYQYIAADLNNDRKVTSADALRILELSANYKPQPSQWVFLDDRFDHAGPLTRTSVVYQTGLRVELEQSDAMLDLKAVFKGDVDGDWSIDKLFYARKEGNRLSGTSGNDSLVGDADDNVIIGNDGNDTLIGGLGYDTLEGGVGEDELWGGQGINTFVYKQYPDYLESSIAEGIDVLKDFTFGVDRIQINHLGNNLVSPDVTFKIHGLAFFPVAPTQWEDVKVAIDKIYNPTVEPLITEMTGSQKISLGELTAYDSIDVFNITIQNGPLSGSYLLFNDDNNTFDDKDLLIKVSRSGSDIRSFEGPPAIRVLNPLPPDKLRGGPSGDWLLGGSGNDTLDGAGGRDFLFGGAGNDVFVLKNEFTQDITQDITRNSGSPTSVKMRGLDVVLDFSSGDMLRLIDLPQMLTLIFSDSLRNNSVHIYTGTWSGFGPNDTFTIDNISVNPPSSNTLVLWDTDPTNAMCWQGVLLVGFQPDSANFTWVIGGGG